MQKTLNILLPVLNEQDRLESGVRNLVAFVDKHAIPCVVTIIDNGSTDATREIALSLVDSIAQSKACSITPNPNKQASKTLIEYIYLNQKGVGLALRAGIDHNNSKQRKSAFIGYMDIDLSTNLYHLLEVYERLCAGSRIVVGSRLLQDSKVIGRSLKREIISRSLNTIIKAALHTSFSDAMCGFKFYQANIATLLRQKCNDDPSWFYCAQMLIQAQALGIEIEEIPVRWEDDSLSSKVQITKLARIYLKEIYHLRSLRQAILAHKRSKLTPNNADK